MAPSSRLQFPFPLFPTSLARFPSTTTFCPSAPLVCSVTARLVADTPQSLDLLRAQPSLSLKFQPFSLKLPGSKERFCRNFWSQRSIFKGKFCQISLFWTSISQGRFCQNFLHWPLTFPRGGSAKIFCADHQFQGEVLSKFFEQEPTLSWRAHIHIYTQTNSNFNWRRVLWSLFLMID